MHVETRQDQPAPKTTLLPGAEAYHEFEAERQAEKAESQNKDPKPHVHRGEVTGKPADSSKPERPAPGGAGAAVGVGVAGGMVKPKGQHGKGPVTGNDKVVDDFRKEYEAAGDTDKPKKKRKFEKKIKELRKKAKNATGKEKKALQDRANHWKAALKVITDGKVRSGGPLMLFNVPLFKKLLQNDFTDPNVPDKT